MHCLLAAASTPWDGFSFLAGSGRLCWLWAGSPSGAFGLAASGAQELTLGDDVGTAAQQLLTALTDEVLAVPGQVFHALVVFREDDLERETEGMRD